MTEREVYEYTPRLTRKEEQKYPFQKKLMYLYNYQDDIISIFKGFNNPLYVRRSQERTLKIQESVTIFYDESNAIIALKFLNFKKEMDKGFDPIDKFENLYIMIAVLLNIATYSVKTLFETEILPLLNKHNLSTSSHEENNNDRM